MRVLGFLAVAALVLAALLFVADATLEKSNSPVIVTSQRTGLPEPPRRSDEIQILTTSPAPAPDMTSQAIRDAQPKSNLDPATTTRAETSEAQVELPLQDAPVAPPVGQREHHRRSQSFDRFSIKGQ
jgi:hypothetical protein